MVGGPGFQSFQYPRGKDEVTSVESARTRKLLRLLEVMDAAALSRGARSGPQVAPGEGLGLKSYNPRCGGVVVRGHGSYGRQAGCRDGPPASELTSWTRGSFKRRRWASEVPARRGSLVLRVS